jgi:NAD(P)-dependent dehydrogenase (short-subunit alcohol dehydrogenase family)
VIGAGDFIGGEIAKKFASEGFTVFAGRRNGAKLEPLVKEIENFRRRNSCALARRTQGGRDHLVPRPIGRIMADAERLIGERLTGFLDADSKQALKVA